VISLILIAPIKIQNVTVYIYNACTVKPVLSNLKYCWK